ncbi:MAG TPA: site-specific integrase [Geothrix sp.]|nr:site-specific integrase [Geothrix sp.]HJV47740.1 site-specific integrase [Geothrix sp.]
MRGPDLPLEKAAAAYLDACQVGGNVAAWIYQQGVILQDFRFHVERMDPPVHQLAHAEPYHLYSFLSGCRARGNAQSTLHRKGTIIRAWARWALTSGLVKRCGMAETDLVAPPPAPLDIEPFSVYLDMITSHWHEETRDFLLLLLVSGLRRGELLALRWKDCDLAAGLLIVRPQRSGWRPKNKGAQGERGVGIPPWAVEILARRQQDYGGAGPFLNAKGERIVHPATMSHRFLRMTRRKGLKARLHDLRHAHGTEALQRGASIREVQVQLGHSRVTTTERYTHVNRQNASRMAGVFAGDMPQAAS